MFVSQLIAGGLLEERIKKVQQLLQPHFNQPIDLDKPPFDLLVIRPVDSIGIDEIRKLKRFLSRRPYQAEIKAGLITEAEKLTLPAQNSLLKTLEEPPENSLVILLASQPANLLPTIISRVKITRLPTKSQISLSPEEINQLTETLKQILNLEIGERLKLSLTLVKNKDQALQLTENFLFLWRQILRDKAGLNQKQTKSLNQLNLKQIEKALKNTEQVRKMLVANVNFHLAIESLFLSYPRLN
ncbi:MAG TPA: hypothetical protein VMY36_04085 [Patescibacteria group bacterium]|nr:hypothetical protein [Patescibacteria group bacterium]